MNPELPPLTTADFLSDSSFSKAHRVAESAWTQHVPFAFWLIEQVKPKLFVELGVHTGVSYFAFCQSVLANKLPTLCYGVDTWVGDVHAGLYDETIYLDVSSYNAATYAAFSYLLKTTFNEALPYFEDASIDLLHIDGYHTYEAVKEDFESWLPKMTANGVVVFHDIVVRERGFGVYKFWSELKQQYKSFEFVHGHGLGLLALGEVSSVQLARLFSLADAVEISKVRGIYANLGARMAESFHIAVLQHHLTQANEQVVTLQAQHQQLQAQYEALHNEHEQLKKLVTGEQDAPITTIVPQETP